VKPERGVTSRTDLKVNVTQGPLKPQKKGAEHGKKKLWCRGKKIEETRIQEKNAHTERGNANAGGSRRAKVGKKGYHIKPITGGEG